MKPNPRFALPALAAASLAAAAVGRTPDAEPPQTTSPSALAEGGGGPVTVRLRNGERLSGIIAESTDDTVTLDHPSLGRVVLRREGIASIERVAPPKEWAFSAEAGLNGSSGNTEALSLHGGLGAKRTRPLDELTLLLRYDYSTSDGEATVDKGRLFGRQDWRQGTDSPWRFFADGAAEYDRFQDWDWRVSGHGGFGYDLVRSDTTTLVARAGAGAYRKIGDSDNNIRPEAVAGLDWEQRLAENQRFTLTADFLPALDEVGPYRVLARAAYHVLLDQRSNLSLRLGLEDQYDSRPGEGKRRNDLTYFAALVVSF